MIQTPASFLTPWYRWRMAQIHKDGDEGGLAVGGHQGDHLVLDGLDAAVDLSPQPLFHDLLFPLLGDGQALHLAFHLGCDLLAGDIHEGSQVGQADALAAVLVGGHLGDDLGGDVAGGGEAVGLLDKGARDDGAVLEHILQVDQVAVVHMLGKVVGIVEVDQALLVRLDDVGGQQQPCGQVFGDLAGHIVPLHAVDGGVLVGVFLLDLLVVALDQAEDALVGGVGLALEVLYIAIGDIVAGHVVGLDVHQLVLHHILYLFHADSAVEALTLVGDRCGDLGDLLAAQAELFVHRLIRLGDSHNDLGDIKGHFGAVPLDDLHEVLLLSGADCTGRRPRRSCIYGYGRPALCPGTVRNSLSLLIGNRPCASVRWNRRPAAACSTMSIIPLFRAKSSL